MTAHSVQPGCASRVLFEDVTGAYVNFALGLRFEDIPPDVVQIAKEQLVATIGSCLGGSNMPGARTIREAVSIFGEGGTATLFGARELRPAPSAALYNSATAQVIDWDDFVIISHSGAAVIPTAFAAAETGGASGRELIAAVVIGNEINARTSRAIQKGAYVGNSMPNHQVETPLVAARLLGLDELQTRRAVAHSTFLAMESCPIGWTGDSKLLANGLPALWGIVSAALAKAGLVGYPHPVEHPAGYLSTVSEVVDSSELMRGLGSEWHTRTLNTKFHPSCAYNLPAIECALAIRERAGAPDPARIKRIVVHGPSVLLYVASRFQALEPDVYAQIADGRMTHVALCFDAAYPVIASLVYGEMSWRQYLKEAVLGASVSALRDRVEFKTDIDMHKAYYASYSYGARVEVELEDGGCFVEERRQFLGARDRPFDHAVKFRAGAEGILAPAQTEEALCALRALEKIENVRELGALLRPALVQP